LTLILLPVVMVGCWKGQHNEKFHNIYASQNVIGVIKSVIFVGFWWWCISIKWIVFMDFSKTLCHCLLYVL